MSCYYYKNDVKIGTTEEVIQQFYENTKELKNASIYSSDQIQRSTYDKIMGISDINTFNAKEKTVIVNGEKTKVPVPSVTEFISTVNPEFERLGIKTSSGRLNPEYIKDNRIAQFVLDNKAKVEGLTAIDPANLNITQEYYDTLRADKRMDGFSDVQLKYLLNEIEDTMNFEEKVMTFGTFLHNILFNRVKGNDYTGLINSFISDPENAEIIGDGDKSAWENKIHYIVDKLHDTIMRIGLPITEMYLSSDIMVGKVDIIAVDSSGTPHIFDLKISKHSYIDWDSAKLGAVDWQMAFYKQLLGQHVDVEKSMLFVLPIRMDDVGDPNLVHVEQIQNRSLLKRNRPNGDISVNANKILPRRIVTTYDPEREQAIISKLNQLFEGEDYELKSDQINLDKEKIMKIASDRFARDGQWKYWPDIEIAGEAKKHIIGDTKEEFEANLIEYLDRANTLTNNNTRLLQDALKSAVMNKTPIKTGRKGEFDSLVNKLFGNYINDDWEVVDNVPEALAMGIILLRNKLTNNLSLVSMNVNQPYATSKIEGMTYGDLEMMKAFLLVNEMKKEFFPGGYGKLGQIIVFNPNTENGIYVRNVASKFKAFRSLMHTKGLKDSLTLDHDNISAIEDIALYELDSLYRAYNGDAKEKVDNIFKSFRNASLAELSIDVILDIQKTFYEEFPTYKSKTFDAKINFEDPIEMILAQIQVAIITKSGFETANDYQRLTNFSMGFNDITDLLTSVFSENRKKYTKTGKRIEGLLGGMIWSPPDWALSKDLRNINRIMSLSNQHIRERNLQASEIIHQHTKTYYKAIKFSTLSQGTMGETQSKHKNLWLLDNNGEVTDEFRTKDPYAYNDRNALEDHERTYLQNMLLIINQWRYGLSEEDLKNIDVTNIDSIRENEDLAKAIDEGTYFEMPLIRREEISRHQHLLDNRTTKEKLAPYWNDVNDTLDTRELTREDLDAIKDRGSGYYEMYDIYAHQSRDFIAKNIAKHTTTYFEWNLDTIANRMAFSKIRKQIYDKRLPMINAYIWWIKLNGGRENAELSKQLESISNQMKLSIFDDKIVDSEWEDVTKVAGIIKRASSIGILGFKIASLPKELTVGIFKAVTLGATKLYGKNEFTMQDIAKGYGKLITIDRKASAEFNLIDKLNLFYGIANMDMNSISKKVQSDRRGLMRGLGRYMFSFNTIPDYYNRLALVLAKMIKDGSYEAHYLTEDDKIKYDPTKDKRYSYYFQEREKYKKDGFYLPAKGDKKYNEQRNKYNLAIELLNKEYAGTKVFSENGNMIDKAYSEVERSSMKSFTDLVYGYYDKDSQSPSNNTWWGVIFLQFKQFWPAKMKMWFAKETDDSPMGHIQQATVKEDGVEKPLWKLAKMDADGEYILDHNGQIEFETTTEDTGDPIYEWKGSYYEGLMYSLLGTLKDVITLDFSSIKSNEDRNRRAAFALADGFLVYIMMVMFGKLVDAIIADGGEEGLTPSTLRMAKSINFKAANEYNLMQSTFGAIESEPVFVSWSKKLAKDTWGLLNEDREFSDLLKRNFGAAEYLKWVQAPK